MRVSAIVLCCDSQLHIERCIRSLARVLEPPRDEILVVDNGSRDRSPRILARLELEFAPFLRVIRLDENVGTTRSRNLAAARAGGSHLLIVDSDVDLPHGTLDPLLRRLAEDSRCGIVAPRLVYPDGRHQISADVFPTVPGKLRRFLRLKSMERREGERPAPAAPSEVDYAISAFWLMRREVFERVGPLDERLFFAPEDVDYCVRVWEAGYRVVYDPTVYAIHDARETSRHFNRTALRHVGGLLYLFRKHRYAFGRARLYRRLERFERSRSP